MKTFTQIPPGTQILIGRAARRRRALERAICSVFEGWSYEEIVPPIFDYYDVFIKGMGTGLEEQIYRFIDRDGNILALRPEFTSLVAKTVVTRLNKAARPDSSLLLRRGSSLREAERRPPAGVCADRHRTLWKQGQVFGHRDPSDRG